MGNYEAALAMRLRELGLLASIGGNTHNEALSHAHLAHLAHLMGDAEAATCEATTARQLAATSPDGGYAARIEEALSVERWSDLETG